MPTKNGYSVTSISLPSDIWDEVDNQKNEWRVGRSAAILRIYQEWKELRHRLTVIREIEQQPDSELIAA